MPDNAPVPLFATEADTGKFVKAIFLKKNETLGKQILGATAYTTPAEILNAFKAQYPEAGKDASYSELPHQVFKEIVGSTGAPEHIQEELLQNMRLLPEFGYYGGEALEPSLSVCSDLILTIQRDLY